MAKEKKAKTVRAPKVPKVPKEKKNKIVVRYGITAKDGSKMLEKKETSQAAAMYAALAAAKEPLTIAECYEICKGKMESMAAWERLGKNRNSTLFALRKAGFVKRQEKREEAETAAA